MSVTCTPSIQADIKYDGAPHYSISPTDYPQTDGRVWTDGRAGRAGRVRTSPGRAGRTDGSDRRTDEPPDERKQAPSDLSNVRSTCPSLEPCLESLVL